MNTKLEPRVLKLAAMSVVALGLNAGTVNSYAASASANATATVVAPIAISKSADLSFGKFAVTSGAGGTVVIPPTGARSATGNAVLLTGTPGGGAIFSVSGDANATYSLALPGSITVTHTNTVNTMSVDTFTSNPTGVGLQIGGGGTQNLNVGATLHAANNQLAGAYSGSFSATVEYN